MVSAMEIASEAQTLLFPANAPVGQETWSPGESGPRGGWCDTAGESRAFAAQVLNYHGTVKVQRLSRTHGGAGMLDDGAPSGAWALTVPHMSCCWASFCTAI